MNIDSPELILQLAILVPLLAVPVIIAAHRFPNIREMVTILASSTVFCLVLKIYTALENGEVIYAQWLQLIPGLEITFRIEPVGILFALTASFLWVITSIYSIGYMRGHHEKNQTRFYAFFALSIASTMGVAFSANMFSMFIFYELLTLATYPLVTHSGKDEAKRAGRIYLGYLLGTSICLQLLAIIWTWSLTGTLEFIPGGVFDSEFQSGLITLLFLLYVFGIGKAALMPFHRWLPAAMVAPTPVSALLHAVAVVKAGVFCILKISVYLFGLDELLNSGAHEWVLYISGATIIIASLIALHQDNLKARLAYSTISQLSYVIMATVVLAPLSIMGAAMHIAAHAFGKITLFFAAGSISVASHKTLVSELDGIGRKMPLTMIAFAIGSLSMIGVPLTAGFLSKWYMLQGAFTMHNWIAIIIIIISTLLNAAYFLPIVYAAFFRKTPDEAASDHGEAPLAILIALVVTSTGTITLFIMSDLVVDLLSKITV